MILIYAQDTKENKKIKFYLPLLTTSCFSFSEAFSEELEADFSWEMLFEARKNRKKKMRLI